MTFDAAYLAQSFLAAKKPTLIFEMRSFGEGSDEHYIVVKSKTGNVIEYLDDSDDMMFFLELEKRNQYSQ